MLLQQMHCHPDAGGIPLKIETLSVQKMSRTSDMTPLLKCFPLHCHPDAGGIPFKIETLPVLGMSRDST